MGRLPRVDQDQLQEVKLIQHTELVDEIRLIFVNEVWLLQVVMGDNEEGLAIHRHFLFQIQAAFTNLLLPFQDPNENFPVHFRCRPVHDGAEYFHCLDEIRAVGKYFLPFFLVYLVAYLYDSCQIWLKNCIVCLKL